MSETPEVKLARLEERLHILFGNIEKDEASKDSLQAAIIKLNDSISKLDSRLNMVENNLATTAPTIEEFITIKHKVVGAGIMGRWIWAIAGGVITFLFAFRREIIEWFSH